LDTKVTIIPQSIAEQLLYNTVLIEGLSNNLTPISSGTGFFFTTKINEIVFELILTNKHVIENCAGIKFRFHEAQLINNNWGPIGTSFEIILNDIHNFWVPHPNPEIDLGALLFLPISEFSKNKLGKIIFRNFINELLIKTDEELQTISSVADEVIMAGYPIALRDDHNNFPIIRKGITATHPATNFQNKSIGIVDIACFPGSSGSPILICMEGSFPNKNGGLLLGNKIIFLGLLSEGPAYTTEGKIVIKKIPTSNYEANVENQQMIHLGYYVKAKEVLTLCNHIADLAQNSLSRSN